jgi:predicted amidohydrolase YtcJ
MDARDSLVQAVAIRDGVVVATGTDRAMRRRAAADASFINLGGHAAMPGIVDGHVHPEVMLRVLGYLDGRFATTASLAALLGKISARAAEAPAGEWIIVAGAATNTTRFPEKRLPTRAELDAAAADSPVLYMNGPHEWVVNSRGVQRLGLTRGKAMLKGASVELDAAGEPTGVIHEGAPLHPDLLIPEADLRGYYERDIPQFFLARGVTSLLAISALPNFKVIRQLAAESQHPPIRYAFAAFADSGGHYLPASFESLRMPPTADPAWFRLVGIKIWLDGDVPVRTGYVSEPYAGDPTAHGLVTNTPEQLDGLVRRVHDAGLAMLIHATGDRANSMALDAYARARQLPGPPTLLRVEHFGDFFLDAASLTRARQLDVKANVQPGWVYTLAESTRQNLGPSRAEHQSFRFRSMIEAGLEPGYGSDLTGFVRETENPFMHLQAAVTRRAADGTALAPEQAISVTEGLRMMTIWSARAQGEGDVKGSLEPGKFADIAVLSADPGRVAPERLGEIQVLRTIVAGQVVYEAGAAQP